jgi:hypothetical protein
VGYAKDGRATQRTSLGRPLFLPFEATISARDMSTRTMHHWKGRRRIGFVTNRTHGLLVRAVLFNGGGGSHCGSMPSRFCRTSRLMRFHFLRLRTAFMPRAWRRMLIRCCCCCCALLLLSTAAGRLSCCYWSFPRHDCKLCSIAYTLEQVEEGKTETRMLA